MIASPRNPLLHSFQAQNPSVCGTEFLPCGSGEEIEPVVHLWPFVQVLLKQMTIQG
jgi:hypothetical protein